jgi:hypothetical protein
MQADLTPCPFCGASPVLENLIVEAVVRCAGCRATLIRRHAAKEDTGVGEVIAAWNRRIAAPAAAGQGWMPIESAPKDGTWLLMYRAIGVAQSRWQWNVFGTEQEWGGDGWSYPEWDQPTHWMPLPPPPLGEHAGGSSENARRALPVGDGSDGQEGSSEPTDSQMLDWLEKNGPWAATRWSSGDVALSAGGPAIQRETLRAVLREAMKKDGGGNAGA